MPLQSATAKTPHQRGEQTKNGNPANKRLEMPVGHGFAGDTLGMCCTMATGGEAKRA